MHPLGSTQDFLQDLVTAEHHAHALSAALLAGHPEHVASAAHDSQRSALALTMALQALQRRGGQLTPECKRRLRRLGQDLAQQREACLRRGAVVDRALNSMLPCTRPTTYAGAAGPYGQQARRTGAFRSMTA
jgi:hypothetical protein